VLQYAAGVFGGAGHTDTAGHRSRHADRQGGAGRPSAIRASGEPDIERSPKPKFSIGANAFYNTLQKTSATAFESAFPSYASATGWLGQNVALFETGEDVEVGSWLASTRRWPGSVSPSRGSISSATRRGVTSGVNLNSRGYYAEVSAMTIGCLGLALATRRSTPTGAVTRDQQSEVNAAATSTTSGSTT
jgi:hypothetical protein